MPGKVSKKNSKSQDKVVTLKKEVDTVKSDKKLKKQALKKKQEEELKKKQEEELKKKQEEELKKQATETSSSESSSESDSSSESSSESEAEADVADKAAAKAVTEENTSSSSDSSSDSDEEDSVAVAVAKVDEAASSSSSDSSSDSSSSESEDEVETANVKVSKVEASTSSSSSSESSSSESEEETEVAKADSKDAEVDSETSSSSSSDSSSSSEESDDEMEDAKVETPSKKRVAEDSEEKENKVAKTEDTESKTVFVGNLSWNVNEDTLREHFSDCGEVAGARVITDRDTNRSKGYGYVDFVDSSSVPKALEKAGSELDGRELRVDVSVNKDVATQRKYGSAGRVERPTQENPPSATLFVGNLSFRTKDSTLRGYFAEVANVISVRIPTDKETEKVKGFGYVQFASVDDATKALDACKESCELDGRQLRVNFAAERPNREGGFNGNRGGRGAGRGGRGGNRFQSRPSNNFAAKNNKITFD